MSKILNDCISLKQEWATVADFIFWGSKIIADGECSHDLWRIHFDIWQN